MRFRLTHTTAYSYAAPVSLCHNEAHLAPRNGSRQNCLRTKITIRPEPAVCVERKDYFGNRVTYFAVQESHQALTVTAASEVELATSAPPAPGDSPSWEAVRRMLSRDKTPEALEARQFVLDSPFIARNRDLASYAKHCFRPGDTILEGTYALMHRIHKEFTYDPQFTTIATPLSTVLKHRRGVCQDFAHLAIACLRALGLAARYVSGYIETLPPPGKPRLVGADASHAWCAVFIPEQGWVDFDPTNDQVPTDKHVTLAWGRDYSDVTPLKGVIFGGGKHQLKVSVDVERVATSSEKSNGAG